LGHSLGVLGADGLGVSSTHWVAAFNKRRAGLAAGRGGGGRSAIAGRR
jgi:hypothetical protein